MLTFETTKGTVTVAGKIRVGISSCLLGNKVRFDGGHQWDRFLTDTLGQFVEYVPVCPEVECGMPVAEHKDWCAIHPEQQRRDAAAAKSA